MKRILLMKMPGAVNGPVNGCVSRLGNGFTLIELMIVVAIVSIILTLAVPTYADYMIRAKIGEALSVGAGVKTAIAETCTDDPTIPAITSSNTGLVFTQASSFIDSIALSGPCTQPVISIQTRMTGATPDPVITLTGFLDDGRVNFTCATSGLNRHVPLECRS